MITNDQDLINVDYLKTRMSSLLEAFPEPFFNHAMAVKVKSLLYATTLESDFKISLFYDIYLYSAFHFFIYDIDGPTFPRMILKRQTQLAA